MKKFGIYQKKIQLNPEHTDTIISTTCILHNYIISSRNFVPYTQNLSLQSGSNTFIAFYKRNMYI